MISHQNEISLRMKLDVVSILITISSRVSIWSYKSQIGFLVESWFFFSEKIYYLIEDVTLQRREKFTEYFIG